MAKGDPTSGRILRSLVEPPPPVVEDLPPPVRRGRKPGSKNKPKPQSTFAAPAEPEVAVERPRRGRRPGSKNRPKAPVEAAVAAPALSSPYDPAAAMRSYGFGDDETVWSETAPLPALNPGRDSPAPELPAEATDAARTGTGRPRLRDRSAILKRYVLDIEPRPGQPGALRARRRARAAR